MAAADRRLVALAVGTGRARRAVAPLPERHWHRERRDRRQLVRDDLRRGRCGYPDFPCIGLRNKKKRSMIAFSMPSSAIRDRLRPCDQ